MYLLPRFPQIICLSEARINQTPLINIELPNYKLLHNDSPTRAGGVAIYVASNINIEIVSELYLNIEGCENIWIKLCDTDVIIAAIYRHPKNRVKTFIEHLNVNLELLKNSKVYLVGDININIDTSVIHTTGSSSCDYINMLASNGFYPLITLPTRVTVTSSTVIDHIITNDHKHQIFPGIIKADISDHYFIFCDVVMHTPSVKTYQPIFRRDLRHFDTEAYCDNLNDLLLNFFQRNYDINSCNFDNLFAEFVEIVKRTIDFHAPVKKLSRKQRKLKLKPWITRGIFKSIKHKQKLYQTHFVEGNWEQKNLYKKYSNKLNKIKLASKKLHYQTELEHSKYQAFRTWNIIKSLLPSSGRYNAIPEKIKINNNTITDVASITENFNDYFSNIGQNLASKIVLNNKRAYKNYLSKSVSSSLFLQPTSQFEVKQQICSLSNKKSSGPDDISAHFLVVAADVLVTPLTILFNYALKFGIFPSCLKIAKVIPVFKSGNKTDVSNYRPISILSTFSKILEKLICKRTRTFLDKNSVLIPTQYGFRPLYSTSHAMLDVLTTSFDNINSDKNTALILLDLKKAFDTVNHNILISKLQHYGIRGTANSLFASFLTNRYQYVSLNGVKSSIKPINCGVPQGSVLGPLLFTLYINDISNCTTCDPRLFADDTCLILHSDKLSDLNNKVTDEVSGVNKWMNANKLTLNVSKSNVIVIKSSNNKNKKINLVPSVADSTTGTSNLMPMTTNKAKYLGVTYDNCLCFKSHINTLEKKLSRAVGILAKVKPFLNKKAMLLLYYAIFHSHLQYGIIAWSSTFKSYLYKLSILQNKAVKIIGGGKYFDRATPFYSNLNILKLFDIIKLETASFVYKFNSNALPAQFNNYLTKVNKVYKRSTRASFHKKFFVPFFKSSKLQRSIKYQGPLIWNSLTSNIKESKSIKSFKFKLKQLFLSNY